MSAKDRLSSHGTDDPLQNNVFVTQINEKDNVDYRKQIPIVKESPEKLVRTGLNTYQDTLVVKQESELSRVDVELHRKKFDFEQKMTRCARKKAEITEKQMALVNQMDTFGSFIQENDTKKRRALVRYQTEVKMLQQHTKLHDELNTEMEAFKDVHQKTHEKMIRYTRYQDFLLNAIDIFPQDYIKISDNVLNGLIMRYNTLSSTNSSLITDMTKRSEESYAYSKEIAEIKQEHANLMLQNNYRLSLLYSEYEKLKDQYEREEMRFRNEFDDMKIEALNSGLIQRSIDNIATKCSRIFEEPIKDKGVYEKLEKIEEYIKMSKEVLEIARSMKEDRPVSCGVAQASPEKTTRPTTRLSSK